MTFGAYEIKTLLFPADAGVSAVELDLIERPTGSGNADM